MLYSLHCGCLYPWLNAGLIKGDIAMGNSTHAHIPSDVLILLLFIDQVQEEYLAL